MRCKIMQKKLVNCYYQELDPGEETEIKQHLLACADCQEMLAKIKTVLAQLKEDKMYVKGSPDFWRKFEGKVFEKINTPYSTGRKLIPVLAGAFVFLLIIFGSIKIINHRQEKREAEVRVAQDLELLEDLDLLKNLELMENLSEVEQFRG